MLALLSGANPRTAADGPSVRLAKGTWKVHFDGVVDTDLIIVMTSKPFVRQDEDMVVPFPIKNGHELNLEQPATVRLMWHKRGSENFVSVSVEKVA